MGISYPLICGAMYPCTNIELVAAVSEAGGIGVIQPLSIIYAQKQDLRASLKKLRQLTQKPYGFNILCEASSKVYLERMRGWVKIALEEGCRFFVTALGNPKEFVEQVKPYGAIVYHDVTERKWAEKASLSGVDGFICVNNRAGGHTGNQDPKSLWESLHDLGKPLVCAGGVGDEKTFLEMLAMGYAAVQMGTRYIATTECYAHQDYKQAIVNSHEADIVLTDKISGVPVSVIRTPYVDQMGTHAGGMARAFLRHPKLKHWMRLLYTLRSMYQLKKATQSGSSYRDYWQAGKSVETIHAIESAGVITQRMGEAWLNQVPTSL